MPNVILSKHAEANLMSKFWIEHPRVGTSINGCYVHFGRFLLTLFDGCQAKEVRKKYIKLLPIYYLKGSREEKSLTYTKFSNKNAFSRRLIGLKLLAVCYCRPYPRERNVPTFPLNGILKRREISSMLTDRF